MFFPPHVQKELDDMKQALENEYSAHHEDRKKWQLEVSRSHEHARVANARREESEMALASADAQIEALTRELRVAEEKVQDKSALEVQLQNMEEKLKAMATHHGVERNQWEYRTRTELGRLQDLNAKLFNKVTDAFATKCNRVFRTMRHGMKGELLSNWHEGVSDHKAGQESRQISMLQTQLANANDEVLALQHMCAAYKENDYALKHAEEVTSRLESELYHAASAVGIPDTRVQRTISSSEGPARLQQVCEKDALAFRLQALCGQFEGLIHAVEKAARQRDRAVMQYQGAMDDRARALLDKERVIQEAMRVQTYLDAIQEEITGLRVANSKSQEYIANRAHQDRIVSIIEEYEMLPKGTIGRGGGAHHPTSTNMD